MAAIKKAPVPPLPAHKPWEDARISANGQAVSENFKAWFDGSKIVGKDGTPLRLFHGTTRDFESFDPDRCRKIEMTGAEPRCFFFSDSPEVAQTYCGQKTPDCQTRLPTEELYEEWKKLLMRHGPIGPAREFHQQHEVENLKTYATGGQVIAAYVSARKILKVNARGDMWNLIRHQDEDWDTNHLIAHARAKGYDGVCIKNVHDRAEGKGHPSDVYAFFHASQIKSALGNSGLYLKESRSLTDEKEAQMLLQSLKARQRIADLPKSTPSRRRAFAVA